MYYTNEQARTQALSAPQQICNTFGQRVSGQVLDAEFFSGDRKKPWDSLGFPIRLPSAPIC